MKTLFFFSGILISITILFSACKNDDPEHNHYEDCCGNVPVEFSITGSGAHVYVPNVFTPNNDGINDQFLPSVNDFVVFVNYMVITQDAVNGPPVLYQVQNVDIVDLWTDKYWNGRNAAGEIHKGKFNYEMSLTTIDDQTFLIQGSGCSIVCDDDAQIFNTLDDCFYPTQSEDGHLNPNIANQESGCFH